MKGRTLLNFAKCNVNFPLDFLVKPKGLAKNYRTQMVNNPIVISCC